MVRLIGWLFASKHGQGSRWHIENIADPRKEALELRD
jgi:hypothetical protein